PAAPRLDAGDRRRASARCLRRADRGATTTFAQHTPRSIRALGPGLRPAGGTGGPSTYIITLRGSDRVAVHGTAGGRSPAKAAVPPDTTKRARCGHRARSLQHRRVGAIWLTSGADGAPARPSPHFHRRSARRRYRL